MPTYLSLTAVGNQAQPWHDRASCRQHNPDIWHETALAHEAKAICERCPVIRDCATDALRVAALPPHRLNGLWAGVDIPLKLKDSTYRNLLKRLRYVAATGMQPPTRIRSHEAATDVTAAEQDIAV